jgi:HD superfamily phosphodiesterase
VIVDRELRAAGPLFVAAGLVVPASVVYTADAAATASTGTVPELLPISIAFAAFIAVGEVLRMTLPGGRQTAPLAAAGSIAFALTPAFETGAGLVPLGGSAALAVSVVTIGSVVGAFPSALVGRGMHLDELARRVLTTLFAAAMFRPLIDVIAPDLARPDWRLALAMSGAAILAALADAVLAAAVRSSQAHSPFRRAVSDEVRALVGISSAISATGVLIALAAPKMGYWALPVFAAPLLLTQFSFRRYATIEATYLQTIRSLSKVTEVGGYTETGHSRRVSRLAVMMGREMGVSERDLVDLEYAALMHDIGQLSLPDPIPGGATTMVAPVDQRRIAELGAEVIRQAGVLDRAAFIVEKQADPYRPHRGPQDDSLPLESRIIKVVNAYDDLVGASLESDRKLRALERLQLGIDREYDPDVVDTLARIIERQTEYAY